MSEEDEEYGYNKILIMTSPAELLNIIRTSQNEYHVYAAAENPHLGSENTMSLIEEEWVKLPSYNRLVTAAPPLIQSLLINPSLTGDSLRELYVRAQEKFRYNAIIYMMAENPNLPADVVKEMAEYILQHDLKIVDPLKGKLLRERSSLMRELILKKTNLPQNVTEMMIEKYVTNPSSKHQRAGDEMIFFANATLPASLFDSEVPQYLIPELVMNPSTPVSFMEKHSDAPGVEIHLNPNCPERYIVAVLRRLRKLYKKDKYYEGETVDDIVYRHPYLPAGVWEELTKDEFFSQVWEFMVPRPDASIAFMKQSIRCRRVPYYAKEFAAGRLVSTDEFAGYPLEWVIASLK